MPAGSFNQNAMNKQLISGFILMLILASFAHANADLAKAKNCMACHATNNKVVGPPFKDIAAKYAGQPGAEDKLVQKVTKGSAGVWGAMPMPANTQVNETEARTIVKWIFTVK